jgi:acetolactate synthase I/II/III large subunit
MDRTITVAEKVLTLARRAGVEYIFCNLGSDHPAFIEAFARIEKSYGSGPKVVICPHEMTALSAAHGYSMITRTPQMVLVHVDVGTENLGGSVHNIARGRVPVLIVAGLSPVTLNGELTGSRTEFIHFLQDTPHQDDIVRPYVKWSHELRAAESAESVFLRSMQISSTEPQGAVYLTGAREVWSAHAGHKDREPSTFRPAQIAGLTQEAAQQIAAAVMASKRPLAIVSYLGRNPRAVNEFVKFSEHIGIGVIESIPQTVNFPGDHSNHLGYQIGAHVDEADFILLLERLAYFRSTAIRSRALWGTGTFRPRQVMKQTRCQRSATFSYTCQHLPKAATNALAGSDRSIATANSRLQEQRLNRSCWPVRFVN